MEVSNHCPKRIEKGAYKWKAMQNAFFPGAILPRRIRFDVYISNMFYLYFQLEKSLFLSLHLSASSFYSLLIR